LAAGDHISAEEETCRTRRAVVVDVPDRDGRLAELVEDALAAGAIAIAVAGDAHVDVVVVDLRVQHGFDAGFEAELCVVDFAAWFDEFGHAYAEDVDRGFGFGGHFARMWVGCCCEGWLCGGGLWRLSLEVRLTRSVVIGTLHFTQVSGGYQRRSVMRRWVITFSKLCCEVA
jgi:hypothetical protein